MFRKQNTSLSESELSSIICNGIMYEVMGEVEDRLVNQLVEDFEREARKLVKAEIEKVSISSVNTSLRFDTNQRNVKIEVNFNECSGESLVKRVCT